MIRIVSDTSTLYTPEQGKQMGIDISPLQVTINNQTYRELSEITTDEFIPMVKAGSIPSSSQPIIGEVIQCYEQYPDDEIINISMADGLSGTYLSALGAKDGLANHENIHVVNSRTLCGPHRYLLQMAMKEVEKGSTVSEILEKLEEKMATEKSFLMPQDFEFLKRGGRLTPLAAKIGGLLKIQPVMVKTEDGKRLEKFTVARTMTGAVNAIIDDFKKLENPESYVLYITHANVLEQAEKIKSTFLKHFPNLEIKIFQLTPVFVTQGGPGCIAIQWIQK